jgi:hypothetical protein
MDITALAAEGLSVGEVRRRDYNRVVLAHLAQGFGGLRADEYADGDRVRPPRNVVRDLLLDMATGGMLFGDPAFTPFEAKPDEAPVEVKTDRQVEHLMVTVAVTGQHVFFQCSEPLATWGDEQLPTLRVMARVPLKEDHVQEVTVKEIKPLGPFDQRRLLWAVEEDRDQRYLHVKVYFPHPDQEKLAALMAGVRATFDVKLTNDPDEAQTRFVDRDPAP